MTLDRFLLVGAALGLVSLSFVACDDGDDVPPDEAPRAVAISAADAGTTADAGPASADGSAESIALDAVVVYKSPSCGCCSAWVDHMREAGFEVETRDVNDLTPVKLEHGIGPELQSCHTALAGGYVLEGHVPADLAKRMLEERPEIAGLAVPGMPRGSPGMEMPDGTKDAYDVLAFTDGGETDVYASR